MTIQITVVIHFVHMWLPIDVS